MVQVDLVPRVSNPYLKYSHHSTYNMAISAMTTWIIGGLEGYSIKEGGLPPNTIAGTMAVSTTLALLSSSESILEYVDKRPLSVFLGTTVFFGSIFYLGFQIGNAIRMVKDLEEHKDDEQ